MRMILNWIFKSVLSWCTKHFGLRPNWSAAVLLGLGFAFIAPTLQASETDLEASGSPREGGTAAYDEQRLLIESIVAIIQNYYVDYARADNNMIFDTLTRALSEYPELKMKRTTGQVEISIDHEVLKYRVDPTLSYDELFARCLSIVQMIDRSAKRKSLNAIRRVDAWSGTELVMNALLSGLDSHSALLSPEAYKELRQGTEGSFGGLGVLVSMRDDLLTVVKPIPRSPAIKAGIVKNDRILKINDVSTFGATLDDLVEHMRGEPGTSVNLSVLRNQSQTLERMRLTREIIQVDSVERKNQGSRDGILHLTIDTFSSKTSREVLNAIKAFRLSNGGDISGLVLDLRSNPGGLLDQAVQVADLFLEKGIIVSTSGRREEVEVAGLGYDEVDFPIAVLINEDSASASEIVAGALQDHERAIVIGQPSFGKGSVQTVFELPGQRALKLTIARYYTPKGRSIQNEGIIPDIWLQPITKNDKNLNILGMNRYNNENFLSNHLSAIRIDGASAESFRTASFTGFFEHDEAENAKDQEYLLAVRVIKKINEVYPKKIPREARRASHQLSLAGVEIASHLTSLNAPIATWLESTHKISWDNSASKSSGLSRTVSISLTAPSRSVPLYPGGDLQIPYTLTNPTEQNIERVSLYLTGLGNGFPTQEVLLGRLAAKGELRGTIVGKIPGYWDPGEYKIVIGVAKDAMATELIETLTVSIGKKDMPVLSALYQIIEEDIKPMDGILQAGEKATLRISIKNDSHLPVNELLLNVRNLAGKQLILSQSEFGTRSVGAKERVELDLRIEATQALSANELLLGLTGDSEQLRRPLRESILLLARPSQATSPVAH